MECRGYALWGVLPRFPPDPALFLWVVPDNLQPVGVQAKESAAARPPSVDNCILRIELPRCCHNWRRFHPTAGHEAATGKCCCARQCRHQAEAANLRRSILSCNAPWQATSTPFAQSTTSKSSTRGSRDCCFESTHAENAAARVLLPCTGHTRPRLQTCCNISAGFRAFDSQSVKCARASLVRTGWTMPWMPPSPWSCVAQCDTGRYAADALILPTSLFGLDEYPPLSVAFDTV